MGCFLFRFFHDSSSLGLPHKKQNLPPVASPFPCQFVPRVNDTDDKLTGNIYLPPMSMTSVVSKTNIIRGASRVANLFANFE
jgi:hypothetical protein